MSNLAILKEAFDRGYNAFSAPDIYSVENPTVKQIPANPYAKNSLPHKEFERGYAWHYFENKKRNLA